MLSGRYFQYLGNLKELGVDIKLKDYKYDSAWEYKTDGVKVTKLQAGAASFHLTHGLGPMDLGIEINFEHEFSTYLTAKGKRRIEFQSFGEIESQLDDLFKKKIWKLRQVVVSEVIVADKMTVFISDAPNQSFQAKIQGSAGVDDFSLLDMNVNSEIGGSSNIGYKWIGKKNMTPRFKLMRLKKEHYFASTTTWDKRLFDTKYSREHYDEILAQRPEVKMTAYRLREVG
ncbi:hypothetical protein C900_01298 [Fulvivirga imtechensis AK7]|uniref:Uncharacterized protein n=1 Tax=Fulvivirga imtechensis AK7 TaxID=1237149 RepID=L8JUQ3_9BACT|nr:hypothetical protein C900_01298 [Fulvivirga imtechensis AK7]